MLAIPAARNSSDILNILMQHQIRIRMEPTNAHQGLGRAFFNFPSLATRFVARSFAQPFPFRGTATRRHSLDKSRPQLAGRPVLLALTGGAFIKQAEQTIARRSSDSGPEWTGNWSGGRASRGKWSGARPFACWQASWPKSLRCEYR